MRLLTNDGAGDGNSIPFNNETPGNRVILVWGTVTDVDLEISPDGGTTWIVMQNFTAAGTALVALGGKENYLIRGSVNTGSGVYMDLL
jgi:hypothetical protein